MSDINNAALLDASITAVDAIEESSLLALDVDTNQVTSVETENLIILKKGIEESKNGISSFKVFDS